MQFKAKQFIRKYYKKWSTSAKFKGYRKGMKEESLKLLKIEKCQIYSIYSEHASIYMEITYF